MAKVIWNSTKVLSGMVVPSRTLVSSISIHARPLPTQPLETSPNANV